MATLDQAVERFKHLKEKLKGITGDQTPPDHCLNLKKLPNRKIGDVSDIKIITK